MFSLLNFRMHLKIQSPTSLQFMTNRHTYRLARVVGNDLFLFKLKLGYVKTCIWADYSSKRHFFCSRKLKWGPFFYISWTNCVTEDFGSKRTIAAEETIPFNGYGEQHCDISRHKVCVFPDFPWKGNWWNCVPRRRETISGKSGIFSGKCICARPPWRTLTHILTTRKWHHLVRRHFFHVKSAHLSCQCLLHVSQVRYLYSTK